MSGFWNQSFSTVQDLNGRPLSGAKAFFYSAGTSTPLATYANYDLTVANPNPLSTDGYGRFPAVFLDEADGFFRVRCTTAGGVILWDADQLPIIGPSDGGGGAPSAPVDPNSVMKTGDIKPRYGTGFLAGYVRCNGRSIGTASSGADERAQADCQALYEMLWNADPALDVLGGRGASAAADWGANKPLSLPDFRGKTLIGLDTMGNLAAGVIPAATALGWEGGAASHVLTIDQIPAHDHSGKTANAGAHTHSYEKTVPGGGFGGGSPDDIALNGTGTTASAGDHFHTIPAQGGGAAHPNIQPSKAVTIYIRL